MTIVWNSLRMFLWMTLLTGVAYPLLITAIAQLTMKYQADGSLITAHGKIIGSRLIAQKFESEKYFWGRPSANDYDALSSGGSNLGPTSVALKQAIDKRKDVIMKAHGIQDAARIPSELLYASGSGLDPHITPLAAQFQVDRVLKARSKNGSRDKEALLKKIEELTQNRSFGFLGEPRVNVLQLNLALDDIK